jgi:hypothetical protein
MSFSGELRGYTFYAGAAGGNCVDRVAIGVPGPTFLLLGFLDQHLPEDEEAARFRGHRFEVNVGPRTRSAQTFANAASIGVPLNLAPAELGIGTSAGTSSNPGQNGLKLRVECGTTQGTAKLVALAGTSNSESVLFDNIGGGVNGCGN